MKRYKMFSKYAQKFSTVQKVADTKAVSVLDSSSRGESLQRKADKMNNAAQRAENPRPNNTGMPDNLKSGIESLSGFSMDDVRVHYNSSKPAAVQALAYTQGTDIHVAPGQEKCLPHEAWHVAQQMAGRVSPTTNMNGMPVNDNAALEHEADVMGAKAIQMKKGCDGCICKSKKLLNNFYSPLQFTPESDFKQNPKEFMDKHIVLCDFELGLSKKNGWEKSLVDLFMDLMRAGDPEFKVSKFVLTPYEKCYILTPLVEKKHINRMKAVLEEKKTSTNVEIKKLESNLEIPFKEVRLEKYKEALQRYERRKNLLDAWKQSEESDSIDAYYVPYKAGTPVDENIGSTRVKKNKEPGDKWNPDFVFTDGMNGCALVATKEDETGFVTVRHFQSPEKSGLNKECSSRFRREKNVTDWFGTGEYGKAQTPKIPGLDSRSDWTATNILWRGDDGKWRVISQNNARCFFDGESDYLNLECSDREFEMDLRDDMYKFDLTKKIYTENLICLKKEIMELYQEKLFGKVDESFREFVEFICVETDVLSFLIQNIKDMNFLENDIKKIQCLVKQKFDELQIQPNQYSDCKKLYDVFVGAICDETLLKPLKEDIVSSIYMQNNCLPEAIAGRHLTPQEAFKVRTALEQLKLGVVGEFLYDDLGVVQTIVRVLDIPDQIFVFRDQNGVVRSRYVIQNGSVTIYGPFQNIDFDDLPIVTIRNIANYHFERVGVLNQSFSKKRSRSLSL
ncbi:protein of unknown function [Fibrobacter sp. UWB12]|nr:DUF4157 domain-containing protein [Fibrobacter sp. UWB12]SHK61199.1 protein of unknown function [Fibrobacter sp. UWB12]